MNTLKLHQGRLENLDDLTGYRNYTENILPLPEAAINAAVRDAVYVPCPIIPFAPSPQSPNGRTLSAGRELRPKLSTNGAAASQGESSLSNSPRSRECMRRFSVGLRAHKDWHPSLLPDGPRYLDMEQLTAEIRRLEDLYRQRNKGRDPRELLYREWIGSPFPSSSWRAEHGQDLPQEMEIDTPENDERTAQATPPVATVAVAPAPAPAPAQARAPTEHYPQEYPETPGRSDLLPSFDSFLQRTFAGLPPSAEQSGPIPTSLVDGTPQGTSGSAGRSRFPGPLKSRHEIDATRERH